VAVPSDRRRVGRSPQGPFFDTLRLPHKNDMLRCRTKITLDIAERILKMAATGKRDPIRLRTRALTEVVASPL
jgi:hypothetical protein